MPKTKKSTDSKKTSKSKSSIFDIGIDEIKTKLIEVYRKEALFDGDIILPSGQIATQYLDLKEATLDQEASVLSSLAILHHLKNDIEFVGGYRSGAYALATGAMQLSYLQNDAKRTFSSFFVRQQPRQVGYSKWIEGPLKQGSKVCIVQDLVVDGIEIINTIRRVQEEARAQVLQVIALVDRQDGAQARLEEMGLDYISICKFDEIVSKKN